MVLGEEGGDAEPDVAGARHCDFCLFHYCDCFEICCLDNKVHRQCGYCRRDAIGCVRFSPIVAGEGIGAARLRCAQYDGARRLRRTECPLARDTLAASCGAGRTLRYALCGERPSQNSAG